MALRSPPSRRPITPAYPYANTLTTDSVVLPVSLEEFKRHLRISDDDEDQFLRDCIWQATKWLEDFYSIAFLNQTWKLSLDSWPGYTEAWWDGVRQMATTELQNGRPHAVVFPRYPLSSVTAVTTYDEDSNSTAVTVANVFDVDTQSKRGRLTLKRGATWPTATRAINAIRS